MFTMEDAGWKKVTSRRRKTNAGSGNDEVMKIATTFYVSNFPRYWSSRDLWKAVDKFGILVDAFVPRRRGANGAAFGFVRFINVASQNRLLEKLEKLVFDGIKMKANVSRFPRRKYGAQNEDRGKQKENVEGRRKIADGRNSANDRMGG
ncbi:hypothetical protein LXL04_023770 [Taraxacum kok-saghyz]